LTKHIVQEYGRKGIRAYTLALGNIKTKPTVSILSKAEFEALERESPSGRWGTPKDVAYVVSFLMSNRSSYINGQTIVVDGGTVLLG
jgi:3-oxoacyl-[acyl-carrier protein] reductase